MAQIVYNKQKHSTSIQIVSVIKKNAHRRTTRTQRAPFLSCVSRQVRRDGGSPRPPTPPTHLARLLRLLGLHFRGFRTWLWRGCPFDCWHPHTSPATYSHKGRNTHSNIETTMWWCDPLENGAMYFQQYNVWWTLYKEYEQEECAKSSAYFFVWIEWMSLHDTILRVTNQYFDYPPQACIASTPSSEFTYSPSDPWCIWFPPTYHLSIWCEKGKVNILFWNLTLFECGARSVWYLGIKSQPQSVVVKRHAKRTTLHNMSTIRLTYCYMLCQIHCQLMLV